jgi:hypothetical protein
MSLAILSWSINLSYCSSISYSVVDSSGNIADSIFYITNNVLYVDSNSDLKIASYSLQIKGSIVGTYKTYKIDYQPFVVNV